jgi:two-component system sensor histidine kinase PilS (NtrC family)
MDQLPQAKGAGGGYAPLFARAPEIPEFFWVSLQYFNLYRIVVAAMFLITTTIYGDSFTLGSYRLEMFRAVSAGYLALGIVLHGVLRHLRDYFNLQLSVHVGIDILALTLLMYASGGLRSGLGVMLLISLTAAALVAPRRLTYLYAAVAAIALLIEQSYWVLAFDFPTANYLGTGLLAIGCFVTAGVTGQLAQRMLANQTLARQRGHELAMQMRVNQLVLEDMHDGVLVLDRDGRVVQSNPHAVRLLGEEPLRGVELDRLLRGFAGRWSEWRATLERRNEPAVFEVSVRGRDLRVRLLEAGTEEEYAVAFLEDTTELREQAQQLKLAALGRLTANLAHEIRNPLSAISHAAELLDEEGRTADRARLTRIIGDNTRRLERLVSDVLQLNWRDRINAERVNLNRTLTEFVEEYSRNESFAIERFALDCPRELHVRFDRGHLRQVLWNLVSNAARHASQRAGSMRLALRAYGNQVELNVIDDGPGVAKAHQAQLFEPFFTTSSSGTGLGLYLARELCAANRARLEYVDNDQGAHFRIICEEVSSA